MYPKVKVRVADVDEDYDRPISPLRDFNSLSIRDIGQTGKESKKASSVPVLRVPRSYIQRPMTPPHPLQKVSQMTTAKKTEDRVEHDGKPQIRASSVPRPRAVVSSPDNDQILGSRNKMRFERPSTLKSQNLAQSRHLGQSRNSNGRCSSSATPWKPLKREAQSKETVHTSDHDKGGKKVSASDVRVPRANIVKSKPCFTVT